MQFTYYKINTTLTFFTIFFWHFVPWIRSPHCKQMWIWSLKKNNNKLIRLWVFWNVMPCSLVDRLQFFGGAYHRKLSKFHKAVILIFTTNRTSNLVSTNWIPPRSRVLNLSPLPVLSQMNLVHSLQTLFLEDPFRYFPSIHTYVVQVFLQL